MNITNLNINTSTFVGAEANDVEYVEKTCANKKYAECTYDIRSPLNHIESTVNRHIYPIDTIINCDQILEGRRSQEEIIFNNTTFQIWSVIVLPSFLANII